MLLEQNETRPVGVAEKEQDRRLTEIRGEADGGHDYENGDACYLRH